MNPLKNKHWTGICRKPKGEEDRRKAVRKKKFEEAGKCGKTCSEVKRLAGNAVR